MSIPKSLPIVLLALAAGTASIARAEAPAANGEDVVKKSCAMCHQTPGMGAPLIGNKADWADRIAKGKPKLYENAIKGFQGSKGFMPAKGANPALTDDDVRAAVDFMVGKVK